MSFAPSTGGISFVVGLDPTPEGSFLRRVSCRSPADYSEVLVGDRGPIGAPPKQKLVEPSSANALGPDFGFHPEILGSERDRMIAPSTVKMTRALKVSCVMLRLRIHHH